MSHPYDVMCAMAKKPAESIEILLADFEEAVPDGDQLAPLLARFGEFVEAKRRVGGGVRATKITRRATIKDPVDHVFSIVIERMKNNVEAGLQRIMDNIARNQYDHSIVCTIPRLRDVAEMSERQFLDANSAVLTAHMASSHIELSIISARGCLWKGRAISWRREHGITPRGRMTEELRAEWNRYTLFNSAVSTSTTGKWVQIYNLLQMYPALVLCKYSYTTIIENIAKLKDHLENNYETANLFKRGIPTMTHRITIPEVEQSNMSFNTYSEMVLEQKRNFADDVLPPPRNVRRAIAAAAAVPAAAAAAAREHVFPAHAPAAHAPAAHAPAAHAPAAYAPAAHAPAAYAPAAHAPADHAPFAFAGAHAPFAFAGAPLAPQPPGDATPTPPPARVPFVFAAPPAAVLPPTPPALGARADTPPPQPPHGQPPPPPPPPPPPQQRHFALGGAIPLSPRRHGVVIAAEEAAASASQTLSPTNRPRVQPVARALPPGLVLQLAQVQAAQADDDMEVDFGDMFGDGAAPAA